MIWIDASFAIEWLLGTKKAAELMEREAIFKEPWGTLSAQYAEVLVFFMKRAVAIEPIRNQLQGLIVHHPSASVLEQAATLYLVARNQGSKASLSDAILAATAKATHECLLSFDADFKQLGFEMDQGLATPVLTSI